MAATLACGGAAVLSHRSAAELWRLLPTQPGLVDVTAPTRAGRKRRNGIRIHRPAELDRTEWVVLDRIPVTTVARTLRDISRVASERELRNAIRAAEIAGRPVGDYARLTKGTMSDLELEFLALCRRHRLPEPEVSVWVGGYRVDFLWRRQRLIVETDGVRFHRGRLAAAEDAARDRHLGRLGFMVVRFTDEEVADEPARVAATVRGHLRSRAAL